MHIHIFLEFTCPALKYQSGFGQSPYATQMNSLDRYRVSNRIWRYSMCRTVRCRTPLHFFTVPLATKFSKRYIGNGLFDALPEKLRRMNAKALVLLV